MSVSTRRGFLAVAGAASAGAVAVAAAPSADATPARAARTDLPADAAGSMAAYIHDVRSGEVSVMVEGHEVVVHDKELVARLAHAYATAAKSARSTSA